MQNNNALKRYRFLNLEKALEELMLFYEYLRQNPTVALRIAIYGSARFKAFDDPAADIKDPKVVFGMQMYEKAYKAALYLAKELGAIIITGGGPGIMEAGNRGGRASGAESIALGIELPKEQKVNPFATQTFMFDYFFSREMTFRYFSNAFIAAPGGYGTMAEFFERLILKDKEEKDTAPIILLDREFYSFWLWYLEKLRQESIAHHDQIPLIRKPIGKNFVLLNTPEQVLRYFKVMEKQIDTKAHLQYLLKKIKDSWAERAIGELYTAAVLINRTNIERTISIIGGQHIRKDAHSYNEAQDLAFKLAQKGISLLYRNNYTISEAIARGARFADHPEARLFAFNYYKDNEGCETDTDTCCNFHDIFSQKIALVEHTNYGIVYFPGGAGVLDLFYEVLTLIQTKKIDPMPIVLIRNRYWDPIHDYHHKVLYEKAGAISEKDLYIYTIVNTGEEAFRVVSNFAERADTWGENTTAQEKWGAVQRSYQV